MNNLNKIKKYIILVWFLALFGCATSRYTSGRDFDMNIVEKIQKGVTTKNEIITYFGQPQSISLINSSDIWTYMYINSQGKATNYIFRMDVEAQSNYKSLTITFDDNNIVQGVTFQSNETIQ